MADVKISSYNIHSCVGTDGIYSVDRIARVVREGGADIVCLQEVEVNDLIMRTRIWSSHHSDNQPSKIAKLAGIQYHAFAPAIRSRASSCYKEMHDVVSDVDVSYLEISLMSTGIENVLLKPMSKADITKIWGSSVLQSYLDILLCK